MKVTAVVVGHREGEWLRSALRSALQNVEAVRVRYPSVDARVSVFLDNPDSLTRQVAFDFNSQVEISEVSFGDLGMVRNFAVTSGEDSTHFAFLDGDDLWSWNWLEGAVSRAMDKNGDTFVLHPQINYCFGTSGAESRVISEHVSTSDSRYDPYALVSGNYWSALSFAPRTVYKNFPYVSRSIELSIGFEDWIFNIQTIGAGIEHLSVPGTAHFHRRKPHGSLAQEEKDRQATFFPTRYWWKLARNKSLATTLGN